MKKTNFTTTALKRWMLLPILLLFMSSNSWAQTCNNSVNASISTIPNACQVEINADMVLEAPNPNTTYFIEIHSNQVPVVSGVGSVVITGASTYFGSSLVATITDQANNNSCWGYVVLEDKSAPVINCLPVTISCTDDLAEVPAPIAVDNCDLNPDLQLVNEVINTSNQCTPTGGLGGVVTVTRSYIATDIYGNASASCNQVISVTRPSQIDFPNDIVWTCDQYNVFSNITSPTPLHPYITDTDLSSAHVINVNLDETCDDDDLPFPLVNFQPGQDDPNINSTNILNGGLGCPGDFPPNNGLDDADVLALTGSGIPRDIDGIYCLYQASHSDAFLTDCGSSFKIIRTWTVLDWCTGQVVSGNNQGEDDKQVIKVIDLLPPVIAPMAPFEVNANIPGVHPQPCRSQDFLPKPSVSDNCNSTSLKVFTPAGQGTNAGNFFKIPAPGLPLGVHTITYQAEDACGNVSEMDVQITVVDNVSPGAICDEITDVNLSSDGYAHVSASTFDDGSFDNCCVDRFEVRRMEDGCNAGINFGSTVTFCCEDIDNGPIQVVFRVFDCYDNYNDCMVDVYIQDKIVPTLISCPPNQTITCDFYEENLATELNLGNYEVLNQFGEPVFYDNCESIESLAVNENLDQCGSGTITRTWAATDPSENGPTTCTQIVFVRHVSDWVVQFPADLTVTCTQQVPEFGEPEIFFETCELIAISYEDQVFTVVPDACYKIVRHWSVINWCVVGDNVNQEVVEVPESQMPIQFNDLDGDGIPWEPRVYRDSWNGVNFPNASNAGQNGPPDTDVDLDPWDGYIAYEQVIKVIDDVAPIFADGCIIPDVCIEGNGCSAIVEIPVPSVQDCSPDAVVTASGDLGNGFGPFFNVGPGTYEVIYTATDNCGNTTSCVSSVTVSDCKLPTPYCVNGVVIELMNANPPMIEIWATDFNAGSFDNCPGPIQLSFSSDVNEISQTFGCNEVGQQLIELWVTDAAGNQDFCTTFVIVQDNMTLCNDPQIVNVGGVISNEDDEPIIDVEVELSGTSTSMVMTDQNGNYDFSSVPLGSDVTVTPEKNVNPLNGVTTFDLVLITKHILHTETLNSPYKIIAADANHTGTVTTADLVEIRKLILHVSDEFTNNTSWRFVDKDFEFTNDENPFQDQFPEVISINNIAQDEEVADFIAIKVGDVNSSASFSGGTQDRNVVGNLVLNTNDIQLNNGEQYVIEFNMTDLNVTGYQFTLNFDNNALEFVDLIAGSAKEENFGFSLLDIGAITASWNGKANSEETVFSLVFNAKTSTQLSDVVSINSRFTSAEAYQADGSLMNVALTFNGNDPVTSFELYQNTPNPFKEETRIGFNLPEVGHAKLSIQDVSGKILKIIEGEFVKGYNEVQINSKELTSSGVLYYTLKTTNDTVTRKMILIK